MTLLTTLKNSVMRSAQSTLACLLMKLKMDLTNAVLASMVGTTDKRQMSHIISSAPIPLAQCFVPHHLCLEHSTPQNVIDKHTSPIARRLLTKGQDSCLLVLDRTYLYIQVKHARKFLLVTNHSF